MLIGEDFEPIDAAYNGCPPQREDTLSGLRAQRRACELNLARESSGGSCMAIIYSLLQEENDLAMREHNLNRGSRK